MADETAEQLLARYRKRHGNPYMNLTTARGLHTLHMRYRHLSAAAQQRARRDREVELEFIRRKIFGLDTVASPSAVEE
jgi:hypothetical protein